MTWETGETIVVEEVWRGRVWSRRPVTVVEDSVERLVFWCPRGTRWLVPTTPETRERHGDREERFARNMTLMDWVLADWEWQIPSIEFVRPGEWSAVRVTFHPESARHWGWYVNLQEPFRRTERGIEMMDMALDVVADARRRWRWKDEHEFAHLIGKGLIDAATADTVRAAGFDAIDRLERREEPFDDSWLGWRPPTEWGLPVLSVRNE